MSVLCTSQARIDSASVLRDSQARVERVCLHVLCASQALVERVGLCCVLTSPCRQRVSVLYASQARVESVSVLCASQARVESVSVLCASQARVERVCLCCVQARPV